MIMLVKTFRHQKIRRRAEKFGGKLNLDGEYEWDKPEGRGGVVENGDTAGDVLKVEKIKDPIFVASLKIFLISREK